MANAYFTSTPEGFIDGSINLNTAVIKAAFVRSYTFSAAHKFVSDVTTAGGVLTVTTTASAVNHGILLFQASAVAGGADVAASAQRVIAYYDTGTGLPIQPGTGSTPITWDNTTNRIVKVG
jgi:hypothetical protein